MVWLAGVPRRRPPMLKVEERFMIKNLHRRGMTINDIARITGHDRKKIRAILNGPVNPPAQRRRTRARKLDPFRPYLERRIEEGGLNSQLSITCVTLKSEMYPYAPCLPIPSPASLKSVILF
jgi:hypothetical protein